MPRPPGPRLLPPTPDSATSSGLSLPSPLPGQLFRPDTFYPSHIIEMARAWETPGAPLVPKLSLAD